MNDVGEARVLWKEKRRAQRHGKVRELVHSGNQKKLMWLGIKRAGQLGTLGLQRPSWLVMNGLPFYAKVFCFVLKVFITIPHYTETTES